MHQIIAITGSILIGAFIVYALVLPLMRKRPVVLTTRLLVSGSLLAAVILLGLNSIFIGLTLVAVAGFFYIKQPWLLIGIAEQDFLTAVDRTIKGTLTKATIDESNKGIQFAEPAGTIRIMRILGVIVLSFKLPTTRKTKLFGEVLKKMIDNYFFRI